MSLVSAHNTFIFTFQDNNLGKFQWIFTKHNMFGIASEYILSLLTELSLQDMTMAVYYPFMLSLLWKNNENVRIF